MAARRLVVGFLCIAALAAWYFISSANSVAEGARQFSMQVAGQQRTYILATPQASGPLPTLIFLHGKGSSALRARDMGFEQLGEREHFVTVLPDGLGGEWNVFPPGFRDRSGLFTNGADNTFIKQLVADLVHRGVADPKPHLSERHLEWRRDGIAHGMRCTELFAAIGVFLASMPDYAGQDCHPTKPIALMMVNGTADPIMPYDGGSTAAGLKVWGTERTLTFFRKLNGCTMAPKRSEMRQSDYGGAAADRGRSLGGLFGRADRSLQCSWWWPSSARAGPARAEDSAPRRRFGISSTVRPWPRRQTINWRLPARLAE